MNNFFEEGLPEVILLDSYADKRKGQNVVQKGFQSYFKGIATKERLYLYLPINGSKTSIKEWVKFYKDDRAERTAKEKGFGNTKNMFYHFVKKEPRNPANDDYYYAIPKGFTQSDLLNKESDYSYMVGKGFVLWEFRSEQKLSLKVGLCTLGKKYGTGAEEEGQED